MNIKPGDIFRFVYFTDNDDVKSDEIFSGQMNRWISCDRMCLCIGFDLDKKTFIGLVRTIKYVVYVLLASKTRTNQKFGLDVGPGGPCN